MGRTVATLKCRHSGLWLLISQLLSLLCLVASSTLAIEAIATHTLSDTSRSSGGSSTTIESFTLFPPSMQSTTAVPLPDSLWSKQSIVLLSDATGNGNLPRTNISEYHSQLLQPLQQSLQSHHSINEFGNGGGAIGGGAALEKEVPSSSGGLAQHDDSEWWHIHHTTDGYSDRQMTTGADGGDDGARWHDAIDSVHDTENETEQTMGHEGHKTTLSNKTKRQVQDLSLLFNLIDNDNQKRVIDSDSMPGSTQSLLDQLNFRLIGLPHQVSKDFSDDKLLSFRRANGYGQHEKIYDNGRLFIAHNKRFVSNNYGNRMDKATMDAATATVPSYSLLSPWPMTQVTSLNVNSSGYNQMKDTLGQQSRSVEPDTLLLAAGTEFEFAKQPNAHKGSRLWRNAYLGQSLKNFFLRQSLSRWPKVNSYMNAHQLDTNR